MLLFLGFLACSSEDEATKHPNIADIAEPCQDRAFRQYAGSEIVCRPDQSLSVEWAPGARFEDKSQGIIVCRCKGTSIE